MSFDGLQDLVRKSGKRLAEDGIMEGHWIAQLKEGSPESDFPPGDTCKDSSS